MNPTTPDMIANVGAVITMISLAVLAIMNFLNAKEKYYKHGSVMGFVSGVMFTIGVVMLIFFS